MKYTQDFKIPEVLISNFEGIICFEIFKCLLLASEYSVLCIYVKIFLISTTDHQDNVILSVLS